MIAPLPSPFSFHRWMSSIGGLVCEGVSETAVRRGEEPVRGRGETLCLIDGDDKRHGGDGRR